jgi:hypothetical protein
VATWEDGPEYAPVDWPTGFVAPAIPPLSEALPSQDPSAGAPVEPPARYDAPHDPVPPLAALVPAAGPTRDPNEPFQVASAVVTDGSAWGSVHSVQAIAAPAPITTWTPDQAVAPAYPPPAPMQGFPAPGTPQWFGPPAAYETNQLQVPLTAGNVAEGMGWGLIITLILGGIVSFLSPVLLVIAFFLVSQARFRRQIVKIGFFLAMLIVALAGAGGIVGSDDAWTPMCTASVIACWLLLVYGLVVQVVAIRGGDRPEH